MEQFIGRGPEAEEEVRGVFEISRVGSYPSGFDGTTADYVRATSPGCFQGAEPHRYGLLLRLKG